MKNLLATIKARPWLSATIAILVILIGWAVFGRSKKSEVQTVAVARADVTQTVSITGKTKPAQELSLAFEKSGRVTRVNAEVGDKVFAGQTLVQLDASDLLAQLTQAEANVLAQQAKLDQLKRGAREEDIEVSRSQLAKAEQDLKSYYLNVVTTAEEAYIKADDAVKKQIDDLFVNDEQTNPQLAFGTTNTQKQIDSESGRFRAGVELSKWKLELTALNDNSTDQTFDLAIASSKIHLTIIRSLLSDVMDALLGANSISPTTLTAYKASVTTARTNVNAALASVTSQEQLIASQKITVAQTRNQLNLKLAGSAPEEISAQAANVKQAEASVANIQAQISKTYIRAPISGIVTEQKAKVGQIASPSTEVVSLISAGGLEIEANVPEVDIGRIALGKPVNLTFDALPGETFTGSVASIDPAEKVIEGVSTYKTVVALGTSDSRIKSGMTANLDILVDTHTGVLTLPQRAILTRNSKKYVVIPNTDGTTTEREVQTGLRGNNGEIEVTGGVSEGEEVLRSPD